MKIKAKGLKGFTLIEILIVIALIAILAAITIIAINPQQNFRDARNAQRSANVNSILSGVTQWSSAQGNSVTSLGITDCGTGVDVIGTDVPASADIDLEPILVPTYIVEMPTDPTDGTALSTDYTICMEANGRVTVAAPGAEGTTITVSR